MENNNIRPNGLQGKDKLSRMIELMGKTSINENVTRSVIELTKKGPDGNVYAIVRENHSYFIKISTNKSNLVIENFEYIGGLKNKTDKSFDSYSKALRQLNLSFISLAEANGKSSDINAFLNDNLIEGFGIIRGKGHDEHVMGLDGDSSENEEDVEYDGEDCMSENDETIDEMIGDDNDMIEENFIQNKRLKIVDTLLNIDSAIAESTNERVELLIESLSLLSEKEQKFLLANLKKKS